MSFVTHIRHGEYVKDYAATVDYLKGLKFKLELVLVYADRIERIHSDGQIESQELKREFKEDGLSFKPQQLEPDMPAVGVNQMRSGGDPLAIYRV